MFVKLLIGRNKGAIVDMRVDAAQAGLATGTCEMPTDEEMAAAGMPVTRGSAAEPERMPDGYEAKPNEEDGGLNVFATDGSRINAAPLRNLAEARDIAWRHANAAVVQDGSEKEALVAIPDGYADLAWSELRSLAMTVAPDLRNPSKADCLAAIEDELAKRAAAASAG